MAINYFNIKKNVEKIIKCNSRLTETSATIVAVAKGQDANAIKIACKTGLSHIGENYLQEALTKQKLLTDLPITWHFIGSIQSNKALEISRNFSWVHSIERFKIAQKLNQYCQQLNKNLNVLIQVNLDNESSKSGVNPHELNDLIQQIQTLPYLKSRGIMILATAQTDRHRQLQSFQRAQLLFKELQQQYPHIDTLSMGMSRDYQAALISGSNMIRIGEGIFGPRSRRL